MIDSVLKTEERYYPQVFLKGCKHIQKDKKVIRYITDDWKFSSDDSDEFDEKWIKHYNGILFKEGKYICAKGFWNQKI